jgi:hypothetical protein
MQICNLSWIRRTKNKRTALPNMACNMIRDWGKRVLLMAFLLICGLGFTGLWLGWSPTSMVNGLSSRPVPDKIFQSGYGNNEVSNTDFAVSTASSEAKYGILEVTLTATGNYPNSYLKMPGDDTTPGFVVGTFTGPNGETITIDGFWDGGQTWKIRMTPTAVGTWTYTTSSADPGLDGQTGSFNCIPSNSKGFIRVDQDHPHHFMWDNGTPFPFHSASMSVHAYSSDSPGLFFYGGSMQDGSFQTYVDTRASQGFTAMHWDMLLSKWGQICDCQINEGGKIFLNDNLDTLNPSYFQWTDQRVEYALSKGIIPQLGLVWPDSQPPGSSPERLKRLWRYAIARYAAYNVTWNLFGEGNEWGSDEINRDYGQLTKQWDPYDHLLTIHTTPSGVKGDDWLDFIDLQNSTNETSNNLNYGKPVVNAEYGGYEDYQVDGEGLRPLIWDIRMRGGYFVYETWGTDLQSSGAQYAKLNNLFFRDRTRFWLLEYHPELFGGTPGLANSGQEYVVYLPSGGSITVNLSAVSEMLNVEWYNPRTGEFTPAGTTTGGSNQNFTAPFSGDAVLHIGTESELSRLYLPLILKSS